MTDLPFHSQFQWNRILRGRSICSLQYDGTLHKNIRENFGENISNSTWKKKFKKRIAKNISNNYVENKITPEKGYASITIIVCFTTLRNGKRLGKDLRLQG